MKTNKEEFEETAVSMGVPDHTVGALSRYVFDGIEPGGFLTAVLENDLMESFSRADRENLRCMEEIVRFIYNEIPSECHGSSEKVGAWIAEGAKNFKEAITP